MEARFRFKHLVHIRNRLTGTHTGSVAVCSICEQAKNILDSIFPDIIVRIQEERCQKCGRFINTNHVCPKSKD